MRSCPSAKTSASTRNRSPTMPLEEKRPASTCGWIFSIRTRSRPSVGLEVRELDEEEGGLNAVDLFSWGKLNRVEVHCEALRRRDPSRISKDLSGE